MSAHPLPPDPPGSPFTSAEFLEIEKYLQDFVKEDKPADYRRQWQWDMPNAHLFLFGMINRTYRFAEYAVEIDDLENYLAYAEVSMFHVYKHHDAEESLVYPMMAEYAGHDHWGGNIDQHHEFSEPLEATWLYLRGCRANLDPAPLLAEPVNDPPPEVAAIDLSKYGLDISQPFSPAVLRRHIDSFFPSMAKHMRDEIETLKPENIEKIGEANNKAIEKALQAHFQTYDPTWFLCSLFVTLRMDMLKQALVMPWAVRRLLVPFWFGPKYRAIWRYAPHPENLSWAGSA